MSDNNFPIVAVYCDGTENEAHPPRLVEAYDQFETSPHYWKPVERERWKDEGKQGRLPRNRQSVQRKMAKREKADRLTPEQARRAFFAGTSQSDSLWLRWRFTCEECGYELRRNFGAINAEFDRLADERRDSVTLAELETSTKDH